jgi:hypothetical protein
VPVTAPTQSFFSENGTGGFPGLVSYGNTLDVNGRISSPQWNVQTTYPTQSLYEHFTLLLGGMVGSGDTLQTTGVLTQEDLDTCASVDFCHYQGDVTIEEGSSIIIGAAEKKTIVIGGTLTVKDTVTITPGGFLAFIVKGDITVHPDVGSAPIVYTNTPANPHIQGVYITDGTFFALSSGTPPDKQLILKGLFLANDFTVSRSLSDADNVRYPATMFVYDPSLLFSMPLILQEVPFKWQEVAP